MTNLLGQLKRWRMVERLIRLTWGAGRWVAVVGVVLAVACLTDWLADRYLGSESWRKFRTATWVFAPTPSEVAAEPKFTEIVDETPKWLRVLMTGGQLLLAGGLAYLLLVRPWVRTPPVDELAGSAEKAIPEFGHRLVTAVQLNRPGARTQGMSQSLIAEVTREAGEMARHHNLLKLVNYTRVILAVAVALPVLTAWAGFALARPELSSVLLKRQMLLNVEIPRTILLQNVSQEVWPTGAEVEIRFKVTGEYDNEMTGRLRVEPVGQPEEYYDLKYEKDAEDGGAYFTAKLPASTSDFSFSARLGNGRTREQGRIRFEAPPQLAGEIGPDGKQRDPLTAEQILPRFLGLDPSGEPFTRRNEGWTRGEVVDALPLSGVIVDARFNKAVAKARLIPIERGDGVRERELPALAPDAVKDERKFASWQFPTTPRMIGYRLELVDDRGFVNSVPIRRNIRMLDDRPPLVMLMPETTRHPDRSVYYGKAKTEADKLARWERAKVATEWGDKMALAEGGRVLVIFHAQSEQGIGRANIRYRVIPKGIAPDAYPEEIQQIQHPSKDPENKVYSKLTLKPVTAKLDVVGKYVMDLGLFEKSWQGLTPDAQDRVNIEFYLFPSTDPATTPAALEAGGRYWFEIDGLKKLMPDGTAAKLEVGDTVELFVEVFDKNPLPGPGGKPRPAGYTKDARRKIVVTQKEADASLSLRNEEHKKLQAKLDELVRDQESVFKEPKDKDKEPPKKK